MTQTASSHPSHLAQKYTWTTRVLLGSSAFLLAYCIAPNTSSTHLVASAHAQSSDDIQEAKSLFKKGEKLYKKKEYKEAAEAFTQAYELSKRDELLYYMGTAWEAHGDLLKARSHYQLYLNNVPDAKNAEKILDKVIELQSRIAKEMGRVAVTSSFEESKVYVDAESEPQCLTPCTVVLSPDTKHTIRVVDDKGQEKTATFTLKAGQREEATIATEPEIKEGTLLVRSDLSGASLTVNAKPYPLAQPITLEEGTYSVVLTGQGEQRWTGKLDITHQNTTDILVPLAHLPEEPESDGLNLKRVGAYSLLSASAGLLIGGALLGRQAKTTFATLETQQAAGNNITPDMIQQGKSQQRGANILFITGGLALGSGAGLLTWDILSADKGPSPTPSEDTDQPSEESSGKQTPDVKKLD